MAALKDKLQNALDEARILILGGQALLGVELRSVFETGFKSLPTISRYAVLLGLTLMIATLGLLMAPGAHHQLVERGEDTQRLHRFTTLTTGAGLLPLGISLGLSLFVVGGRILGLPGGIILGSAITLVALFFWYVLELGKRRSGGQAAKQNPDRAPEPAALKDKIRHVLTEARMVLPGAQALLGFQFLTVLSESFPDLPPASKWIHLSALMLVCLSTILLMTPAAYHRIALAGEETEDFHRLAGRFLLAAMALLACGMCADLYVVMRKITGSVGWSAGVAVFLLLLILAFWFGYSYFRQQRSKQSPVTSERVGSVA